MNSKIKENLLTAWNAVSPLLIVLGVLIFLAIFILGFFVKEIMWGIGILAVIWMIFRLPSD